MTANTFDGKSDIWFAEAPTIAEEAVMTRHKQMLGKLLSPSNRFECENIKKEATRQHSMTC
jgi:hypothetical protein